MSGILCFRQFLSDSLWSPSVADTTGTGAADANHPASLLIDGRCDTYFRRTNTSSLTLTNSFGNTFSIGYCVFGLIGVQALSGSTPLPITVRLRVGTTLGGSDVYDGYRRVVANNAVGELNAPANAFFIVDTLPLDDSTASVTARACGGKYTGTVYVTWTLSTTSSAAWTVRETTAWSGFAAKVRPSRSWDVDDTGVLQRSIGGAEFANIRNPKRLISATMIDIDDKQVRGGTRGAIPPGFVAHPIVTANVMAINKHAGMTKPVVFVPNSEIGTSGYTDPYDTVGRDWNIDNIAQSEIVYGYLVNTLKAREMARLDPTTSMWEVDFTIVEAFNGLT